MNAAIYARKSTEQVGVDADDRSVARQVEHATAYAHRQGWTVGPEYVFVDDGVSGAIFGDGRPGLMRLLNTLRPRAPFDVLIMSEESRLGREMHQTAHLFGEIVRAGVRVFFYLDDRERKLETAIDKVMLSLTTFGAELEREKGRQRTRDAMLRKAKAGHVTGGRVFGYDNVRVEGRVERRINDAEAAVVRRIFELAALGHGLRTTAHTLNAEGLPAPRPQCGRPTGWSPSTVRDVLGRSVYRGVIEWDRLRRNNERRQLKRFLNADPLRIEAPHRRIVPADLAAVVDARRGGRRDRYVHRMGGRLVGGAVRTANKHLLTGLLRCPCGATFEAQGATYGRRKGGAYVCSAARRKGRAICASTVHLPMADTEHLILGSIERELLDSDIFADALTVALERLSCEAPQLSAFAVERDRLTRELAHLTAAVAAGGDIPSLVAEIRKREARKADLDRHLARPRIDTLALRRALERRVREWRTVLRTQPAHGQKILRTLLDGPIRLGVPTADGVPWEVRGELGAMLGTLSNQLASPARFPETYRVVRGPLPKMAA